jgi:5-methylcytosine-specific restriction endonuclease McrA
MKRTALSRGNKPLKRSSLKRTLDLNGGLVRTAMTRVPTKRNKAYADELDRLTPALMKRAHRQCEVGVIVARGIYPHCQGRMQRHHRLPRGAGGQNTLENVIFVCSACHEWIEENRTISYIHGWLVHRGTDPAKVPWSSAPPTVA